MLRTALVFEKENEMESALKSQSFSRLLAAAEASYTARPAFSDKRGREWRDASFADVRASSLALAAWLNPLQPADKVMIFSESRIEWPIGFFATMLAGGIAVPVDAKSTAQELAIFIACTQPAVILLSPRLLSVLDQAVVDAQWQGRCLVLDHNVYPTKASLADVKEGENFVPREREPDSTAVIAFTSATSGQPKAVETSIGNLFHQMYSLRALFGVKHGDAMLSILPLSHLLELSCGFLAAFACGAQVNYLNSILPAEITESLKDRQVTHMIVVPLLMEMIKKGIERNFVAQFGPHGMHVLAAFQQFSKLAGFPQLRRLINTPILKSLGPSLKTLIVGGATLDEGTLEFFNNIGIHAWQGYGLTETSPVAAVNVPGARMPGSVGKPMPYCDIRVTSAGGEKVGEIQVRGACVMKGYFNDLDLTKRVIDHEGWFSTGDLGYIDRHGYLFVTGRKKNLVVLDGGKKVHPEEVEKVLSASPLFSGVCVVGVKRPHPSIKGKLSEQVCAVVVPQTRYWHEHDRATLQTLCEQEIQRLCRDLSAYKKPTEIILQQDELPKTRTGKVKAALVQQSLAAQSGF